MSIPASVPVDGNTKVATLTAAADPAAVTVTEATAGTDISCYLTADGWAPAGEQGAIVDSRLCSKQDFEQPGRKTGTALVIRYVFNLNNPDDDEARLALAEGTKGFALKRVQVAQEDAFASEDWYELWPFTAGEQKVLPAEANQVDRIEQKLFITATVQMFKQLVAP